MKTYIGEPIWTAGGMSMLDYFAAAALQGLLANPRSDQDWISTSAVESAWGIAKQMLRAREKLSLTGGDASDNSGFVDDIKKIDPNYKEKKEDK